MGMWSQVTNRYSPQPCTNCGKVHVGGQWWNLRNSFGINGYFCPDCYDLVSHNGNREPERPEQYRAIRVKQEIERATR
jgi:hypothetical protein